MANIMVPSLCALPPASMFPCLCKSDNQRQATITNAITLIHSTCKNTLSLKRFPTEALKTSHPHPLATTHQPTTLTRYPSTAGYLPSPSAALSIYQQGLAVSPLPFQDTVRSVYGVCAVSHGVLFCLPFVHDSVYMSLSVQCLASIIITYITQYITSMAISYKYRRRNVAVLVLML